MSGSGTSFGDLILRLRSAAGLSQEELAERAGLSRNSISDLERGLRQAPRLGTVRLLADALSLGEDDRTALLKAARPALLRRGGSGLPPSARARLPMRLTRLIGREAELASISAALWHDEVRLLTITGPGGVGKTRLAIAVAAALMPAYVDGVVFVDLSPLIDPGLVVPTVATALDVREIAGQSLIETLSEFLAARRLLLLLDNCERLLAAAPELAALLSACPAATILATSREPWHMHGERVFPLGPLPLPAEQLPQITEMAQIPAVALFLERATAVQPDFTLSETNVAAVAAICRRLDGLPLAIELAAALVNVLPPGALLVRLERRLPVLIGGGRDLPARQQTMRNTIAWSHELLTDDEQMLYRRLAVFPGGCTIEAAEAVVGTESGLDAFAGIAALVEKSVLRQEGTGGEPRFRMLETVREYALECLDASDEGDGIRDGLAAWILDLTEQAEPVAFGSIISPEWADRLNEELPNLRAAVTWLLARGEGARALRLLVAAEDFWTQRHLTDAELHSWLETALVAAPDAPARDRALAHWLLSCGNGALGHDEVALRHAQLLLATSEELDDPVGLGFAHFAMALAWEDRGDIDRAAAAYAEVIPLWRSAGGMEAQSWVAQAELADKYVMRGDLEAGVPMLEDALAHLPQVDPPWFVVLVINLRGHAALLQRDLRLATRMFAEAIAVSRGLRHAHSLLGALAGLAGVALARGQAARAARLLGAMDAARATVGMRRWDNWLHAERITADVRAAMQIAAFEEAWSAGRALPREETITEALALAADAATDMDG
jgi:predicted ATPase/DNA-binding XRE family transcriptional regulator